MNLAVENSCLVLMDASAKQPEYTNVERPEDVENVMKIKKKKKEDIFKGLVKK